MNNQAFRRCPRSAKNRKLDAVLHRFTGNGLTDGQKRLIGRAIGTYRQYRFLVEHDPKWFRRRLLLWQRRGMIVRTLFGSTDRPHAAAAVLIQHRPGGMPNTVCIYLPEKKEGERNVS